VYTIGFIDTGANPRAPLAGSRPANGAFFEASSTNNTWYAVVRVNGQDVSAVSTGVATSSTSNLFRRFRIEVASSTDTFIIDGKVVSQVTKARAQVTPMAPVAQVVRANGALAAVVNTVSGTNAALDIASMRVWDDDPPEDRVAASGLSAGGDSAYTYDAVSGASIAPFS
jgi:hypothetical protein